MCLKYSLYCVYVVSFFIVYVIDSEYFIWCVYVDDLYVTVVYDVISNVYREVFVYIRYVYSCASSFFFVVFRYIRVEECVTNCVAVTREPWFLYNNYINVSLRCI